MKTPTEVCADRIRELEAKLQLADEREFYLAAENARLRAALEGLVNCYAQPGSGTFGPEEPLWETARAALAQAKATG